MQRLTRLLHSIYGGIYIYIYIRQLYKGVELLWIPEADGGGLLDNTA